MLTPGDPAPWFSARSSASPRHYFDLAAGQYMVLCFFGSPAQPPSRRVLDDVEQNQDRLAELNAGFCGISVDPEDERLARARQGRRTLFFWDFDRVVSRMYGAAAPDGPQYAPHTLILDPALRVLAVLPFDQSMESHFARVLQILQQLPPLSAITGFAPVLTVPFVFEPDFCRMLIDLYERNGGTDLGTVSEVNGQTVRVHDHTVKRRMDYTIEEPAILAAIQDRLQRRVIPELKKSYQFAATRIERYVVACYDAQTGGHFRAHRDDATKGSAHRRFAVTINLNSDQYEGGNLRFPEFGCRTYRAPTGGAIVFSCSMLHEVRPVIRGKRYAFLPFLYDEQAARVREINQQFVSDDLRLSSDKLHAAAI
jgi:peroxiredoxin/predicted 2-oxoglutarate/Fe(II)-dependent dioxygenase YbiX